MRFSVVCRFQGFCMARHHYFVKFCTLRSRASNRHFTSVIRPVIITVILNAL
jgi:hypothetical protein